MMMKQSADRARLERERYNKQQSNRTAQRKRIPELATKYAAHLTTPKLEKMLAGMDSHELLAIAQRVRSNR
jgi:hypothetical protein